MLKSYGILLSVSIFSITLNSATACFNEEAPNLSNRYSNGKLKLEGDTDTTSFNWSQYEKMDEFELEEEFHKMFNKRIFNQATTCLILAIRSGNEDLERYLINITNMKLTKIVKMNDLKRLDSVSETIITALKKRAGQLLQDQIGRAHV